MKLNQTEIRALAKRLERKVKENLPKIESDLYKSKKIKPLLERWKKIQADSDKIQQERGKVTQSIEKAIHEKINSELIDTTTWKSNRRDSLPFYLDTYYHTETMLREEISLSVLDADNLAELTQAVFKSLNMESK
jgi:seryl-tRNA synthetase|tara:strand:- start:48 stop:452 length:405 start_codon:yes stop_codon:yes gene_type:complete